jgi:DNA replication protein DnaC
MAALDDLVSARAAGRLRARLRSYLQPHLLCLDGVAYQRIDIERLDLLYDLVRKRYDAGRAIVITASLPFAQWPSVMPSTAATAALVDRLVHRATVITIEGESYRKKQAQERAAART